MSTMVSEIGKMLRVSTVMGPGRRKKLPRGGVLVPKGDEDALIAEVVRQATAARVRLGIAITKEKPVV